ncbi:hypothetical protein [Streptomyces aurantiogriseus]|uniref:Uncharacterized protein n=1 Tax=Streptomyces aurantiogriseus TaxID=66870 RepID=A0A918FP27_9ACTN|nr:hypothetical protein [Streptomyces aurantiogriseus]GGR62893.1 hypothetical protein GCM10010251_94500 [Streptomyces aurantiogriseus]
MYEFALDGTPGYELRWAVDRVDDRLGTAGTGARVCVVEPAVPGPDGELWELARDLVVVTWTGDPAACGSVAGPAALHGRRGMPAPLEEFIVHRRRTLGFGAGEEDGRRGGGRAAGGGVTRPTVRCGRCGCR